MFVGRGGMMQDLSVLAPGLARAEDGTWYAPTASAVDYPDQGNAFCFAIEDGSFWFQHRNDVIVDAVRRFPPAGFIADIGAGNGFVSLGLQRAGFDTVAIEPGPHGARNARSRGLDPVVRATLQGAGFLPGSLPAAGLFDVLEHVQDDMSVLRLLDTLLVPGGRLYLTVPAFQLLWSSEDDLTGHYRRYTIGMLTGRLREAGFAPDFATYLFSPLPLPVLLLRSLPTRLGRRTTLQADQIASELRPTENVAVRAVRAVLARERALIRRGWRIPIGSTCLVVAHQGGVRS
jgi:SAM-dependent methyltransferase